jgi:hypothetical protein
MILKKLIIFVLFLSIAMLSPPDSRAKYLVIGVDKGYWYPYTYLEGSSAKGIHIEYVKRACAFLGHTPKFYPLPWTKCLEYAEKGKINAIVSSSYNKSREKHLLFPDDAAHTDRSEYRLTSVGYYIISFKNSDYRFKGDIGSIPPPVFVPYGYSIGKDLENSGLQVTYPSDINECFKLLINGNKGHTITTYETARFMINTIKTGEDLYIQDTPLREKSYFIPFSKQSPGLNPEEIKELWGKIKGLHHKTDFQLQLLELYPPVILSN